MNADVQLAYGALVDGHHLGAMFFDDSLSQPPSQEGLLLLQKEVECLLPFVFERLVLCIAQTGTATFENQAIERVASVLSLDLDSVSSCQQSQSRDRWTDAKMLAKAMDVLFGVQRTRKDQCGDGCLASAIECSFSWVPGFSPGYGGLLFVAFDLSDAKWAECIELCLPYRGALLCRCT
jgi:hypothetical protein